MRSKKVPVTVAQMREEVLGEGFKEEAMEIVGMWWGGRGGRVGMAVVLAILLLLGAREWGARSVWQMPRAQRLGEGEEGRRKAREEEEEEEEEQEEEEEEEAWGKLAPSTFAPAPRLPCPGPSNGAGVLMCCSCVANVILTHQVCHASARLHLLLRWFCSHEQAHEHAGVLGSVPLYRHSVLA